MVRESLPLLIAVLLPLAGVAGLWPVVGVDAMPVGPAQSSGDAVTPDVVLPIVDPAPQPTSGVWLSF